MDKDLFSSRLVELRKERGYKTQYQLAKAYNKKYPPKRKDEAGGNEGSGIFGTLKNYENPNYTRSYPSLDKVLNLCDLLDCDIDYLTGRLDEKTHTAKFVCEYTGLSERAVSLLHDLNQSRFDDDKLTLSFLNRVLSEPEYNPTYCLFSHMEQLINADEVIRVIKEESGSPKTPEEYKLKKEIKEFEETIVPIQSSENMTEWLPVPDLYKEYKWTLIRKMLESYRREGN